MDRFRELIALFTLGAVLGLFFECNDIGPVESQTQDSYCDAREIKELYNKRVIQYRTEQINMQQYRDSLYVDLETYMIKNR